MSIFHVIRGPSSESRSSAISAALGIAASDFGHDAKHVHVLIENVYQIEDEWVAVARVIVEPDLDEELKSEKEKLMEKYEEEHEHKRQKELKEEKEAKEEKERQEYEMSLEERKHFDIGGQTPHIYFYLASDYADIYEAMPKPLHLADNFYPHLIEDDNTWNDIKDGFFPHVDFYEATHHDQLDHWNKFQETLYEINHDYTKKRKPTLMELTENM